ncbi:MAG: hypothetical protein HOG19_18870 [Gammaproteobacteria bacterium]|nr:hypothetical protein [Gammaproteobacteria bacterium]
MKVEVETTARKTENGWADQDGFVGPFRPGNGPRNDPTSPCVETVVYIAHVQ